MKTLINILLLLIFSTIVYGIQLPDTDTIAPPPPTHSPLSGPDTCCLNEEYQYFAELPIGCLPQWFVDDVLQTSDSTVLELLWETPGEHELKLYVLCENISSPLDSMIVLINQIPSLPAIIFGENEPCLNSQEIYTTIVTEGETCQWKIDEVIQTNTTDFIEINWEEPGNHVLEVRAVNQCGISDAQSLNVMVFEMPIVNLGNDTTIFQGQTLTLDAGNPASNFLWNTGETSQSIEVSVSDIYWVEVSNACGLDSDTIVVDVIVGINSDETQFKPIISFAGEILRIEIPGEQIELLKAFDLQGKLLNEVENQNSVRIKNDGICILHIQTNKRQLSTKVLIK